jgi:hypothetical protein
MTEGEIDRMISEGSPTSQAINRSFNGINIKPPGGSSYTPTHRGYGGYHRAGDSVEIKGMFGDQTSKQDEIIYGGYRRAKIEKYLTDGRITIRFVEKDLIPPTMDVRASDLTWAWGGPVVNPHVHCPKCRIEWKSTMMFQFPRFDCPSCGAKKEDHAP